MSCRTRACGAAWLLFVTVFAALTATLSRDSQAGDAGVAPPAIRDGDEIFAADPSAVTELSVLGPNWRLIAHRWSTKDRFALLFSARGATPQTCQPGPTFNRVLSEMTKLRVRRVLPVRDAQKLRGESPTPLLRLTVAADAPDVDPAEYQLLLPRAGETPVVAFAAELPQPVELTLSRKTFDAIAGGCATLGAGGGRAQPRR